MSGILDTRSEPEDVPAGAWRYLQNMWLKDGLKLSRAPGFERAFAASTPFVNQDFHDQGYLNAPVPLHAEFVTMGFEATKNDGSRVCYIGTENRIYVLNETTGVWLPIVVNNDPPEGSTVSQTRFQAAELNQTVVFTNNSDKLTSSPVGSFTTAAHIAALDTLQISAAGVVAQFAGFILIMNVVQSGQRASSRIWWSDFNNPNAWGTITPPSTLSNFQDLDYGDEILAAIQMAGGLYIFTTRAIWLCTPTGGATDGQGNVLVFSFLKVYTDPLNQSKCLVYPNTLVSTGTGVYYASQEAIYYYDPYQPEPVRKEWLFRGGSIMFSDASALDPACCQSPVAQVKTEDKEVWVSWPELSANQPGICRNSKTLVFNYEYQTCRIVDHGFTEFFNYRPSAADSAACKGAIQLFIGASAYDLCLKNLNVNFSRDICTNSGAGPGSVIQGAYVPFAGQYVAQGYYSILRTLVPLGNLDRDKRVRKLLLECTAATQANPCVMRCRVGTSFSEADPNSPDGTCAVPWHQLQDQPIKCLDTMTASQYVAANIRRDQGMQWNFALVGRFIYIEWTIANPDGSAAIGGDCNLSRYEIEAQLATK